MLTAASYAELTDRTTSSAGCRCYFDQNYSRKDSGADAIQKILLCLRYPNNDLFLTLGCVQYL